MDKASILTLALNRNSKILSALNSLNVSCQVKAWMLAVNKTSVTTTTGYQDNILNLPYVTVRIAELENNNFGTDNFLDRAFGVLQYDAQWLI